MTDFFQYLIFTYQLSYYIQLNKQQKFATQ
jgi:hypothetical protein